MKKMLKLKKEKYFWEIKKWHENQSNLFFSNEDFKIWVYCFIHFLILNVFLSSFELHIISIRSKQTVPKFKERPVVSNIMRMMKIMISWACTKRQ